MASEHYKKTTTKHSYLRFNRYEGFFYCRHCHERTEITLSNAENMVLSEDKRLFDRYGGSLYLNAHTICQSDIKCPHCNNISDVEDIVDVSGKEVKNLFNNMVIFDSGDKVRVYLFTKEISFFSKKLQQNHLVAMVVFNTKTGQSYFFEPRYKGTNKRWKFYDGPRLKNISISAYTAYLSQYSFSIDDEKIQELIKLLQEKLQEKFSYPIKSINDYYEEYKKEWNENERRWRGDLRIDFSILANYVRLPNLNTFKFNKFIDNTRFGFVDGKFAYILRKVKPDTSNPIGDLIEAFKGPNTKSIRKLVMKDLSTLARMYRFYPIKDINNMRRLLEKSSLYDHYGYYGEDIPKFIKAMLKKAPENVVVNKILDVNAFYILNDAANMYQQILELKPDYDFDMKHSIKELHDIFSLDYNKLTQKNYLIEYTKQEKQIECDINGYEFRLAKETHELVAVGSKMNICVGSYGRRAYQKELAIIVAYKDDEPIICFELCKNLKQVRQAKLKYNNYPEGELYDLCMKFVEKNDLEVCTIDLERDRKRTLGYDEMPLEAAI